MPRNADRQMAQGEIEFTGVVIHNEEIVLARSSSRRLISRLSSTRRLSCVSFSAWARSKARSRRVATRVSKLSRNVAERSTEVGGTNAQVSCAASRARTESSQL